MKKMNRKGIDVRVLCKSLGLDRTKFARRFDLSMKTVEKWEKKTALQSGGAYAYLWVISHNPKMVEEILNDQDIAAWFIPVFFR